METNTPTTTRLFVTATGDVIDSDTNDHVAAGVDDLDVQYLVDTYDVVHVNWSTAYDGPRFGQQLVNRIDAARNGLTDPATLTRRCPCGTKHRAGEPCPRCDGAA